MEFDHVHPSHRGPNMVHMTRVQMAKVIVDAGHTKVLDLPAGSGELTHLLLERGVDVIPADLDPDGFVVPGYTCVRADLNQILPFEENTFDAMVCIEGIEHIENPHLLAREANRILKKEGIVYISTPNVLSLKSRLSTLLRGYPNDFHYMIDVDETTGEERPIAHINPVGFLELRYVLSRWGFRVELVQTNRFLKRQSPFYRLLRFLLLTKGRRSASTNPHISKVRQMLLSDEVLFGETLILGAVKVRECQSRFDRS